MTKDKSSKEQLWLFKTGIWKVHPKLSDCVHFKSFAFERALSFWLTKHEIKKCFILYKSLVLWIGVENLFSWKTISNSFLWLILCSDMRSAINFWNALQCFTIKLTLKTEYVSKCQYLTSIKGVIRGSPVQSYITGDHAKLR